MDDVFLCEAVVTRLSHDIIGNVGAVANAVELLNEEDNDDSDDIRSILNFSSDVLSKRLKFFRVCFGLSNATVKNVEELKKLITDYLSTLGNPQLPIVLEMHIETPKLYKLIMPVAMLMADTIVKGGKILIKQDNNGIHVQALSQIPLNQSKLENIKLILNQHEIEENPSAYAPLYYLINYLSNNDVTMKLVGDTFIIGE